jgi:hypothetical protein
MEMQNYYGAMGKIAMKNSVKFSPGNKLLKVFGQKGENGENSGENVKYMDSVEADFIRDLVSSKKQDGDDLKVMILRLNAEKLIHQLAQFKKFQITRQKWYHDKNRTVFTTEMQGHDAAVNFLFSDYARRQNFNEKVNLSCVSGLEKSGHNNGQNVVGLIQNQAAQTNKTTIGKSLAESFDNDKPEQNPQIV